MQGSIITQRKKKLHEIIGNAIEAIYTDNIAEYYEVLAEHFVESELFEKAAEHSKLAGKKAQKAASFKDAIEYARKTIFCLEKLPQSDRTQKKIIDARTRLAGYYLSLDHHVDAKEAVAPIVDYALELNYQKRLPIAAWLVIVRDYLKKPKIVYRRHCLYVRKRHCWAGKPGERVFWVMPMWRWEIIKRPLKRIKAMARCGL